MHCLIPNVHPVWPCFYLSDICSDQLQSPKNGLNMVIYYQALMEMKAAEVLKHLCSVPSYLV